MMKTEKYHLLLLVISYFIISLYTKYYLDLSWENTGRKKYFSENSAKTASTLFFLNKKISISQFYQLKLLTDHARFSDERVPVKSRSLDFKADVLKNVTNENEHLDDLIDQKIRHIYKKYAVGNLNRLYDYKTFFKFMRLALIFDPDNYFVSEFGMHLSKNKEMMEACITVLTQVYKKHQHWSFAFKAGWLLLYCIKDYQKASLWLKKAADDPAAPKYVRNIYEASFILGKKYSFAVLEVKKSLSATNNPELKKELEIKLQWFMALEKMNNYLSSYMDKFNKMPDNMSVLLNFSGLKELPADPVGSGFILDFKNKEIISANDPFATVKRTIPLTSAEIKIKDPDNEMGVSTW